MSLYSLEEICQSCIYAHWHHCKKCYSPPLFCHCDKHKEKEVSYSENCCAYKTRKVYLPKKTFSGGRNVSINQHFMTLGARKKDIYIPENLKYKHIRSIYNRYSLEELKYMADTLYKPIIVKYHVNKHQGKNQEFYLKKTKEINAAYDKIIELLKRRGLIV